jgi:hypothetical protein
VLAAIEGDFAAVAERALDAAPEADVALEELAWVANADFASAVLF